jgi:hypothetical protein
VSLSDNIYIAFTATSVNDEDIDIIKVNTPQPNVFELQNQEIFGENFR